MSVHYLLDGYNIIKQLPAFIKPKLKDSREVLFRFIETRQPQGSKKNKVTIVFDGDKDVLSYSHNHYFDILFSKNETADDRIRKIVQKNKNPKNMIVVTDDKELKFLVRSLRAQAISVEDFLAQAKTTTPVDNGQEKNVLSYSSREKINRELKKLWLK